MYNSILYVCAHILTVYCYNHTYDMYYKYKIMKSKYIFKI